MNPLTRLLLPITIATSLLFNLHVPAAAIDISWANAVSGSWHSASNWSPAQVPGPSDVVYITLSGNYTVSINSNASASAIAISGVTGTQKLEVNAGATLTTTTSVGVGTTGMLVLNSGTLSGAGLIDVQGGFLSTGDSTVNSTFQAGTASTITMATHTLAFAGGFTNRGHLWLGRAGMFDSVILLLGGTLTNASTGTIHVSYLAEYRAGALDNQGTIDVDGSFYLSAEAASHVNSGAITVDAGPLSTGTMTVALDYGGNHSFTTSGSIVIGPNSTFSVFGESSALHETLFQTGGSISGPGKLYLSSGTSSFVSNPACGEIELFIAFVTFPSGLVHDTQVLKLRGCIITAPSLTIAAGRTLLISGNTNNVLDIPVVSNFGTVQSAPALDMNGGTWTNQPGSRLLLGGGLREAGSFVNYGEVEHGAASATGTRLFKLSGQLTNAIGGSFKVVPGSGGGRRLECQLHNLGVFDVLHPLTIDKPDADHYNAQTINATGGDLTIVQGGTSPSIWHAGGTINVSPGRTLRVSGGTFHLGAGGIAGRGTLALDNNAVGTFATNPALEALILNNAVATFPGTFETQFTALDLTSASLTCDGIINSMGQQLDLDNTILNAPLVNAGTLTSVGTSFLTGPLDNQGLLTASGPELFLAAPGADHVNTGTIQVDAGVFRIDMTGATPTFTNHSLLRVVAGAVIRPGGGVFTNEVSGTLAGGGTYDMSGTTFINNGTINPGASPGILTITGNVVMGPSSVLQMELGGTVPGSGYDQIQISGNAALDGTLNLSLVNGYFPSTGTMFDLVVCGSHGGQFANVNGTGVGFGNQLAFLPQPGPSEPIRLTTVAQAWSQLGGVGPSRRTRHTAAYDGFSNRLIVFGGLGEGGEFNDTWILEGANGSGGFWEQITAFANRPPVRQGHAAAYDAVNNRLIVYGGYSGDFQSSYSDVWVLSNANGLGGVATWTQLTPGGGTPGERVGASVGYNPASNRLILFGGVHPVDGCAQASNDVWILTNANGLGGTPTWSLLPTGGLPPFPRSGAVMAYDAAANRLVLHAGKDACAGTLAEVRYLSHADGLGGSPEWTTLPLSTPAAPARTDHAGIYDAMTDRLITFGGRLTGDDSFEDELDDVFLITNATGPGAGGWTSLPNSVGARPSARFGHSASWDPVTRRMIIFGGDAIDGLKADVWVLNLTIDTGPVSGVTDPPPTPKPEDVNRNPRFGFQRAPSPNPTSSAVSLAFALPEQDHVTVQVVDVLGRVVTTLVDQWLPAGPHDVTWSGDGEHGPASAGIYFIALRSGARQDIQRVTLLR